MVIIFDNSVFPLKHYVKRFLNAFWGTKSYLWVAKLEESMTNLCPKPLHPEHLNYVSILTTSKGVIHLSRLVRAFTFAGYP